LLFIGAGSSTPFGVPTMRKMVKEFEKSLPEGSDESKLYKDISLSLEHSPNGYDLETVLSVLEALEECSNWHPFVTFINDRLKKCSIPPIVTNESATSASLIKKIKDFLVNECEFDEDNYEKK
jgi:NAD-dependent SIR2 family protein deacetylase